MDTRAEGKKHEIMIFELLAKMLGGPVRENEVSVVTGIRLQQVRQVCRRLASRGSIIRATVGGQSWIRDSNIRDNRKIELARTWKHDSFAVQATCYIARLAGGVPEFELELRSRLIKENGSTKIGKIADGLVHVGGQVRYRIEAEWSRKSGQRNMTEMLLHAADNYHVNNVVTVFAFPAEVEAVD